MVDYESLPNPNTVTSPLSQGYGARLDNVYLRVLNNEENPIQIQYADLQSPRIQTGEDPEDAGAPEFGYKFARSDFTGGEGLDFAHRPDNPPNYRTRFWDSTGVDVFVPRPGEQRRVRLASDIERIHTSSNSNLQLEVFDGDLFCVDGPDILVISDPLNSASTSTEDPGSTDDPLSIVAYGNHLYAACQSDGVYRRDESGSWSSWSNQSIDTIWKAKNRLIGANGNELYEVLENDDSVLITTLGGGYGWTSVGEVSEGILAASSDGSVWVVTITEQAELVVGSQISLHNDVPVAIMGYRGLVFYLTQREVETGYVLRLWRASFQQGVFADITVIRQWGSRQTPLSHTGHSLTTHQGHIYVGVPETSGTYLWKYDLETTGRVRDIGGDTYTGEVYSVVSIGDKLFYSVDGSGIIRELDNYTPSGYLISPLVDFFDSQTKSWGGMDVDVPSLDPGQKVKFYYSTDPSAINDPSHSSWREVIYIEEGMTIEEPIRFRRVNSRYITLMMKLERGDDPTLTPSVRAFSVSAYPGETDLLVNVPVNVSDRIERPGRRAFRVDGLGHMIYSYLQSKHSRSVYFELFRPEERLMGTIIQIGEVVPYVNKMNGSVTYISTVTIRGRRINKLTQALSSDLIGLELIGVEEED